MACSRRWIWFVLLAMSHFAAVAGTVVALQWHAGQQAEIEIDRAVLSVSMLTSGGLARWSSAQAVSAQWGSEQSQAVPDFDQARLHVRRLVHEGRPLTLWIDTRDIRGRTAGVLPLLVTTGAITLMLGFWLIVYEGKERAPAPLSTPVAEPVQVRRGSDVDEIRKLRAQIRSHGHNLRQLSLEMRTPLTAVIGYAELMIEESQRDPGAMLARDLDRVNIGARRVLEILDDVLAMTRVRDGDCQVEPSVFRLDTLLHEIAGSWRAEAASYATIMTVQVADEAEGTVFLDREKVRHIVRNLVGRAVRATTDGVVDVRLVVLGAQVPLRSIEILDNGLSLSPDQLEGLVGDWYGQHTVSLSPRDDVPIGLRVAREYVRLLGGSISVVHRVGGGTAVRVVLPADVESHSVQSADPK